MKNYEGTGSFIVSLLSSSPSIMAKGTGDEDQLSLPPFIVHGSLWIF